LITKVVHGPRVVVAFNKKVVPKQIAGEEGLKRDIKMEELS
jgi:sulfur carrier protein ThiS